MDVNPWLVSSLDDFSYLCCPECVYRSKETNSFQAHALQNHPKSLALFIGTSSSDSLIKDEPEEYETKVDRLEVSEELEFDIKHEDTSSGDESYSVRKRRKVKKETKKYSCQFCSREFDKRCDLRTHVRTDHEHPVQCDECDRKFESPSKLTQHKYMKHKHPPGSQCAHP